MDSSASGVQIEDQTDEDFFDKLVDDDEFDGSQSKLEEVSSAFSKLGIGDVINSLDDSGEPEKGDKVESSASGGDLKLDETPITDPVESEGLFDSNKVDTHALSTVRSDGSKGTSVKEVQWSAFSVDTSNEFAKVSGYELYSEFPMENSNWFLETPAENFSANVGSSSELQDFQIYGSTNEQTADQNDPQYWENLYPGWKFDASTGQWYQVDGCDGTLDTQFDKSNVASVESVSENTDALYLQQSSQPVLESIAEECTVSSVSNWNEASVGSIEYPPNMVFDPQYPQWYYDTNTQQWYTFESYTQALANISNAVRVQLPEDVNALAGLCSDQSQSLYSNIEQSQQHSVKDESTQEFGRASLGIYAPQNSSYSDIGQPAQPASPSLSSQEFGQTWNASTGNYGQNSFYNNASQPEQMTNKGWGDHGFGQNLSASASNLAEQNNLYSSTSAAAHHTARSLGSGDFGQGWDSSVSNHSQKNALPQGKDSQGFGGNWDASRSIYSQQSMWQPLPIGGNVQTACLSGNQQTGGSNVSTPGSQKTQATGFKAFEPVVSQKYSSKNGVTGFQSFAPKESIYKPKVETLETHLSNSYFVDQNIMTSPQKPFQATDVSYSQFSYTPSDDRSSAGRPPHTLVAFGFGGKLIIMKNAISLGSHLDYGNQARASDAISVLNLSEIVTVKGDASGIISGSSHDYFHALCQPSFPGPLVGGNAAAKDVNKWIDEKIGKSESASMDFRKGEVFKLLFSLLKILCQHYGRLRSHYGFGSSLEEVDSTESAVTKLFASARNNSASLTEVGPLTRCMHVLPSEGQIQATAIKVQNLLVSGRRKEALQYAQEGQLWGPAIVLALQLGQQFYVDTVKKMAQRQFVNGSPLRTLCLLIAGQPADVFSAQSPADSFSGIANGPHGPTQVLANGMLDDWEENLAIITANRTENDELVILHLGDCLLKERGEIIAAHTCYLVAEANLQSYSDSARLCLIGADHWKCPRTYASPEAIQRTEVYEYSKVLGNSQFVLLPFQPYKLIYAHMLAEMGKVSESLRYCQASLKLLKNSSRVPEVEVWKTYFLALEERLRTHQQGGYGSNLDPAKLVGKFFTSIDRSIHRMIGAPPAPLPTPQTSLNSKDNFSMPPKVASSQSTMAMSSLMPSASVEAISEWAGDGSRKYMHNRSVSEPDFGRCPKQDAGSVDAQSKSSGAPSRLGRIGSTFMGWVSRSRADHQAKLGESNKFYYDEKLKRWVEEGAEPPAEEAVPPPPPTAAMFQNGALDYSINSAFKNQSLAASGGPETKASGVSPIPSEPNTAMPPIPPTPNQFSARGRMGVRSRYVDTFNKGAANGSGRPLTSSFQSPASPSVKPASPSVKPAIGTKFFVPVAPAPSNEQKSEGMGEGIQEPTAGDEPSTSVGNEATFSRSSTRSPSPSSLHRFPSVDHITPSTNMMGASHSSNGSFSRMRAASWSGTYSDADNNKMAAVADGSPPQFLPHNPPSTRSSCSSSLQLNGAPLGDELHEVEL